MTKRKRAQNGSANRDRWLERGAARVTTWSGSTNAFALAVSVVIIWLVLGPIFGYSDTWQLVINTGTTIITFLMVFLIQRTQNKESLALQLKLNELVAATRGASNRLIDVESLSEAELHTLHQHFTRLAEMTRCETDLLRTHSIDGAAKRHERKHALATVES